MRDHLVKGVIFVFILLSGCSGARTVTVDDGPSEPSFEEMLAQLPASETFDEAAYPAEMPTMDVVVTHDVPVELMEGRAGAGISNRRSGYRINVAFAREKDEADQAVEEMTTWLRRMRDENPRVTAFQTDISVHNIYLQPYFRVRIGDFSTQQDAEILLNYMLDDYPDAFVVVDQVTIEN